MFEFNGVSIVDPFLDETGRFEVNPVKYYGKSFINSDHFKQLSIIKKLQYKIQYKVNK